MDNGRAKLDFGDDDIDIPPRINKDEVRAAAKAVGFQPTSSVPMPARRTRRRTGRVHQFATRLNGQTIEAIHDYADRHDITLAEVLERAIEALIRSDVAR